MNANASRLLRLGTAVAACSGSAFAADATLAEIAAARLTNSTYVAPSLAARETRVEQDMAAASEDSAASVVREVSTMSDGSVRARDTASRFVTLGSGMNYRDGSGAWRPARAVARAGAGGAVVYDEMPVAYRFQPNANREVAVEVFTRAGVAGRSALAGLTYYDPSTLKSVVISGLRDSRVQYAGAETFYTNAFDGVDADILYRVHPWGIEQDVVLFGGLPPPESLGLSRASARLCAVTELVGLSPADVEVDRNGEAEAHEPAAAPLQVFVRKGGERVRIFNWQPGFAFEESGTVVIGGEGRGERIPVRMRIVEAAGRLFLSEEIQVSDLFSRAAFLENPAAQAPRTASLSIPPRRPVVNPSDETVKPKELAAYAPKGDHRFVFDYVNYSGTNGANLVFQSGQTYFITNTLVIDGGRLTLMPGAIVKYATNASITFINSGWLETRCHAGNPAILTTWSDGTVGEAITNAPAGPQTNLFKSALVFNSGTADVRGVSVRYANVGIELSTSATMTQGVRFCEFRNCGRAIEVRAGTNLALLQHILVKNSPGGIWASTNTVYIRNSTFDGVTSWAVQATGAVKQLAFYNNVFASVTNQIVVLNGLTNVAYGYAGKYLSSTQYIGTTIRTAAANPFVTGAFGSNYLVQTSAFVNAGSLYGQTWGVYHYTTATNGVKETNSLVDLGFHYATTNDLDGDGLADCLESLSGGSNYVSAVDISDWTTNDTDGDGLWDGAEYTNYLTNPKSSDTDGDGYSDLTEVTVGSDPLSSNSVPGWISGSVSYTGRQTGAVLVQVTSYVAPTSSPVFYYDFSTNAAVVTDLSGYCNTGAVSGATWMSTGVCGACYSFDGNDRIAFGDFPAIKGQSNATWAGWMKYTGGGTYPGFMGNTDAGNESYQINLNGSGQGINVGVVPPSRAYTVGVNTYPNGVTNGSWQFVSVTYDGTKAAIQINGIAVTTSATYASAPIRSNSVSSSVGDVSATRGWYFAGQLDEMQAYKEVLSTNQLRGLFHYTRGDAFRKTVTNAALGSYGVTNLPTGSNYWTVAWIDSNGNGRRDYAEAFGSYAGNPIFAFDGYESGIDISLGDPDVDSDGLPDWWEVLYFGSFQAQSGTADPDGDGFTNAQEYAAGTNPNQFDPAPTVTITSPQDGDILP